MAAKAKRREYHDQTKRQHFHGRRASKAAVVAARRIARGKHGNWLRFAPRLRTEKGGKNAGRAPRYDQRPADGPHGAKFR